MRKDPEDPEKHMELGGLFEKNGTIKEAINEYINVIRLDPSNLVAQYAIARLSEKSGNLDEALKHYEEIIGQNPDDHNAHNNLGRILEQKINILSGTSPQKSKMNNDAIFENLVEQAIDEYSKAAQLSPDNITYNICLYQFLDRAGRYDVAIAGYRELINNRNSTAQTHFVLGSLLMKKNHNEDAVNELIESVGLDPDNSLFHDTLGNAFMTVKRYEEAIHEYREAMRLDESQQDYIKHLSQALELKKQQERQEQSSVKLEKYEEQAQKSQEKYKASDLLRLWHDTEQKLRDHVSSALQNNYGNDWIELIEKEDEQTKLTISNARSLKVKESKVYGRYSENFLDYTTTADLFYIFLYYFDKIFKPAFGKTRTYWAERTYYLVKIRFELAHSRINFLTDYEKKLAIDYCKEILNIIDRR
jgi:tetratricopeptide (TPR) repeat protein